MGITNYGELRSSVRSFFNDRSDIPPIVFDLASAELNSRLNLREMETETTLSVSSAATPLPADFLRPIHVYLDTDSRVPLRAVTAFGSDSRHRASGQPVEYVIAGDQFLLNPAPDGTYSVVLRYVGKLPDFNSDADTNPVLTKFPALFLYASLKHAAVWAQDQDAAVMYGTALETEIKRVGRANDLSRYGFGPLRVQLAR